MSSSAQRADAPRFALGQRVRIIANEGGLYAAQIGVIGVISKQRQKRRYGYRSYDVTYMKPFSLPNEKGREKIVIVREDDLESASEAETEPLNAVTAPARFTLGQQVKIISNRAGLYPTLVRMTGVITLVGDQPGARWHRVGYRDAKGCDNEVLVREDDIQPEKPPLFSKGEHVTVDPRSELAYETFTRKGAVGVVMLVGKPVRGIRRYQVLFEVPHLGGRRASRIREEHLVKSEAPAPRQYVKARHAYEYRDEHPKETHLWCDAGGCFIEACEVCRQHPVPTLFPAPAEMPYSTAALTALDARDAYEFALALVRDKLERGLGRDSILAWQATPQWIHIVGGGTCYEVTRAGFYLAMLKGQKCSIRYALKTLVADAERRIAGVPHQVGLWGSEAQA